MEKEYWQQFANTGRVEDYLHYRMERSGEAESGKAAVLENERSLGVRDRESDCTDGNGAVYSSGWRI